MQARRPVRAQRSRKSSDASGTKQIVQAELSVGDLESDTGTYGSQAILLVPVSGTAVAADHRVTNAYVIRTRDLKSN